MRHLNLVSPPVCQFQEDRPCLKLQSCEYQNVELKNSSITAISVASIRSRHHFLLKLTGKTKPLEDSSFDIANKLALTLPLCSLALCILETALYFVYNRKVSCYVDSTDTDRCYEISKYLLNLSCSLILVPYMDKNYPRQQGGKNYWCWWCRARWKCSTGAWEWDW